MKTTTLCFLTMTISLLSIRATSAQEEYFNVESHNVLHDRSDYAKLFYMTTSGYSAYPSNGKQSIFNAENGLWMQMGIVYMPDYGGMFLPVKYLIETDYVRGDDWRIVTLQDAFNPGIEYVVFVAQSSWDRTFTYYLFLRRVDSGELYLFASGDYVDLK